MNRRREKRRSQDGPNLPPQALEAIQRQRQELGATMPSPPPAMDADDIQRTAEADMLADAAQATESAKAVTGEPLRIVATNRQASLLQALQMLEEAGEGRLVAELDGDGKLRCRLERPQVVQWEV